MSAELETTGLLVHEWIERAGGAEKVLDEFVAIFPRADILTLWDDAPDRYPTTRVRESWIARTSLRSNKALALPMMPLTWRTVNVDTSYDWLLVSSHLFAHHVQLRGMPDIPKFVYAHTPARYIWTPELDQRGNGLVARTASTALRPLDRRRAAEPVAIAANSEFVRDRVRATWRREATVIYPPVDTERLSAVPVWSDRLSAHDADVLGGLPESFVLGASRFVAYKRLDRVIEAGEALGLPVVIAGSGPLEMELRGLAAAASVPVVVVTRPSDALLYALYQAALVFVFPAIEDFGIMPVEAMACGTPVISDKVGGAAESVGQIAGGASVDSWEPSDLRQALAMAAQVDRVMLRERSKTFSRGRFQAEVREWVVSQL